MAITTIIDGFYGDSGKGKLITAEAKEIIEKRDKQNTAFGKFSGIGIRSNGGPNGGHALEFDGKRITGHVLPSTIIYPEFLSIVGAGCVFHPEGLLQEIGSFKGADVFKWGAKNRP